MSVLKRIIASIGVFILVSQYCGLATAYNLTLSNAYIFIGDRPILHCTHGIGKHVWEDHRQSLTLVYQPIRGVSNSVYVHDGKFVRIIGEIHFVTGKYHAKLASISLERATNPENTSSNEVSELGWKISAGDQKLIESRIDDEANTALKRLDINRQLLPSELERGIEFLFIFRGDSLVAKGKDYVEYFDKNGKPLPNQIIGKHVLSLGLTFENSSPVIEQERQVRLSGNISIISRFAIVGTKQLMLHQSHLAKENSESWQIRPDELERLIKGSIDQSRSEDFGFLYYKPKSIPSEFFSKIEESIR